MTDSDTYIAETIKQHAAALGFDACGIAKADSVAENEQAFMEQWLADGKQAGMSYLERHRDLRYAPALLEKGCKSVIVTAFNYYSEQVPSSPDVPRFARYAYGKDYHHLIKERLYRLLQFISEKITPTNGRAFVDSAPVMERYWARKAGLGWQGKNNMLIIPQKGSFFFLGELFVDIELPADPPFSASYCGNCTRCLDACPAHALEKPYCLNARQCLSYQTIENKETIPQALQPLLCHNTAYGCDICQEVCPHNRFARPHQIAELMPSDDFLNKTAEEWKQLDKKTYKQLFKHSAVERAGFEKLKENIRLFYHEEAQE